MPLRRWFLRRLHVFFSRSIGGHSLHAGGATSLAAAGVPSTQIQAIGRWKSAAFERYIRRHPTVLQALVENPGISYSDILILIPDSRAVYDLIFTLFILLTLSR